MTEKEESYFLVPRALLEKIASNQETILSLLVKNNSNSQFGLGDYISEGEAKNQLEKKTTWFWKMRTSGLLPASKVGGRNYYRKQDIQKLLDSSFTGNLK